MRAEWRFAINNQSYGQRGSYRRRILPGAVVLILSALTFPVAADTSRPDALFGPDQPEEAGYSYLSDVEPLTIQDQTNFDLKYRVCNYRPDNKRMAFAWIEAGFGLDINSALAARRCAHYTRGGTGYQTLLNSTLLLSDGTRNAKAYVPCEPPESCEVAGELVGGKTEYASLSAVVGDLDKPERTSPLAIVTAAETKEDGSTEVTVDWAAVGGELALIFPEAESSADDLAKAMGQGVATLESMGIKFSGVVEGFTPGDANVAIVPFADAKESQFGRTTIKLPADVGLGPVAVLVILNADRVVLVRMVVPLPEQSS